MTLPRRTVEFLDATLRQQCADAAPVARVAALLGELAQGRPVTDAALAELLAPIARDLARDPCLQLAWWFSCEPADFRALHALNACRLAMFLALADGKDAGQAAAEGACGLFYDIGLWLAPAREAVLSGAALDDAGHAAVQSHCVAGEALLRRLFPDELAARVALEHHERADGTGYPASRPRSQLHDLSLRMQIVDSLLGQIEPRPWRPRRNPVDAMGRLAMQGQRGLFDGPQLRQVLLLLGLYPVGSLVRLSSGEVALVTGVNAADLKRPGVRLLTDDTGEPRQKQVELRLADYPALHVADGI
ncbi:MAG: hypothetical protein IT463_00235 [Planctomycetes bacterium]|nr:hypothetical protein [Planctomycetota bacterium]